MFPLGLTGRHARSAMHGYLWHACALGSHCNSFLTRSALLRLTCTAPHGVSQQSLSGAAGVLGGFYTQADIKELIGYAGDRGVMPQTRRSAEQQPGCKPTRTDTQTQTRTHTHKHMNMRHKSIKVRVYGSASVGETWKAKQSTPHCSMPHVHSKHATWSACASVPRTAAMQSRASKKDD